jgi:hypothetical protein
VELDKLLRKLFARLSLLLNERILKVAFSGQDLRESVVFIFPFEQLSLG